MHFAIVLLTVVSATIATPSDLNLSDWNDFKLAYNKVYDAEEEKLRFQIFSENLNKIAAHNTMFEAGLATYKQGVTQFADMTKEEFKQYLTLSGPNPILKANSLGIYKSTLQAPPSIDYRSKGAVNPVKNQGSCGSCWAFSATGTLESINFLKNGELLSLSEQNLVDCSNSYGNAGCNGGIMQGAYDYIKDHGLMSEDAYPYTAINSICRFNRSKSVISITGYTSIQKADEGDLQDAVGTVGPVAVAVDASEWQFYTGGIFRSSKRQVDLNHGVITIGYGDENGQDYWIVRNSWGSNWGEVGYIRVARNANNQIGIADQACYPNL